MQIGELQVITQDLENRSHLEQVVALCEGGIDWIQLRLKTQTDDEAFCIVKEALSICKAYNCKVILNDRVDIAAKLEVDGVHLGKSDMPLAEARKILGGSKIIGATANTIEDLKLIEKEGIANYIGLGPFRFTETKKNLAEILPFSVFKNSKEYTQIPIVAIGGINSVDIAQLVEADIHGVAVSSSIVKQKNVAESAREMKKALQLYKTLEYEFKDRG